MDETIRETSPGAAKRLETSIHDISPRKAGIASVRPNLQKSVSMIESAGITQIQQDSPESARSSRFSKIPSNQPDSPNQLDSAHPTDSRPRLSTNEPPSSTARHSSRTSTWSGSPSSKGPSDFFGFVGYQSRGPRALLVTVTKWSQVYRRNKANVGKIRIMSAFKPIQTI